MHAAYICVGFLGKPGKLTLPPHSLAAERDLKSGSNSGQELWKELELPDNSHDRWADNHLDSTAIRLPRKIHLGAAGDIPVTATET